MKNQYAAHALIIAITAVVAATLGGAYLGAIGLLAPGFVA
jgi:hypothetical protein